MMEKDGTTTAELMGRWVGSQWRKFVSGEARVIYWLKSKRLPGCIAHTLAWSMRLSFLLIIASLVVLIVAIVAIAYVSGKSFGGSAENPAGWPADEQNDHKKSVFYDPINYSDSDDPRFDD